ncbi:MAG: efflux RND transporter periplasmic adaptor subunit, partial [Verrucomicrobiae bacterium]|nr:efflux RND transporter periplasmic adaptor subunit [Verrucomicrobiae bacterium]MDW7979138.1 efflux RND transporter periplasmic adaptor subunit [Verrucomicrobiales bacterium]
MKKSLNQVGTGTNVPGASAVKRGERLCLSRCMLCGARGAGVTSTGCDAVQPPESPKRRRREKPPRTKRAGTLGAAAVVVLLGTMWLTGCGGHREGSSSASSLPVAQVRAERVVSKQCITSEEIPGTVRAKTRATLEAKIPGRIAELPVAIGQAVRTGDLIARLDANEIKARLDQARAMLDQATRDRDRFTALLAQQAVTQAEYDAVTARYRMAEASVREAETMLGYAEVRAPFDGVVNRKFADVGDLAAPGKPLVELEAARGFRFECDIPEALISHVRPGSTLPVRIDALELTLDGVVSEIAAGGDPLSRT